MAWAARCTRGVGGFKEGLKASSRRSPTTPRRRTHHVHSRCRTISTSPDFGGQGREKEKMPHRLRACDEHRSMSYRPRSVGPGRAPHPCCRAGPGSGPFEWQVGGVRAVAQKPMTNRPVGRAQDAMGSGIRAKAERSSRLWAQCERTAESPLGKTTPPWCGEALDKFCHLKGQ